MKNILILVAILFSINTQAQRVAWVPTADAGNGCALETDCTTNTLCYSLEYTPDDSGILTSYTSGFIMSCIDGSAKVLHNQSCVINDNSNVIDACADHGKSLLNCSGNTGQLVITKDEPIILHQVCFNIDVKEEVILEEDPISGMTVSIDLTSNEFTTSNPKFDEYVINSRNVDTPCDLEYEELEVGFTFGLQVAPNPTTDAIQVYFNDGGKYGELSIMTVDNKRTMSRRILCDQVQKLDLNGYKPGTYVARVEGENETVSKKFIVIK